MKNLVSAAIAALLLASSGLARAQQTGPKKSTPQLTSDDISLPKPDHLDSKPKTESASAPDPLTAAWNAAFDRLKSVKSYRVRRSAWFDDRGTPLVVINEETVWPDRFHSWGADTERIIVGHTIFDRAKPHGAWNKIIAPDDFTLEYYLEHGFFYKGQTRIKSLGLRSLNGNQVEVYEGSPVVATVSTARRIRILVGVADGLLRQIEILDSEGHLMSVHHYYDYNKDIVIEAP